MRSPQHSLAPLAFTAIKAEIKQAMDAASARIVAEREANLNHAVAALTQSWVTAIREAATTGKITPAIADVVNDGSKFMDAYQMDAVKLPSAYGQLSYRMTYNLGINVFRPCHPWAGGS